MLSAKPPFVAKALLLAAVSLCAAAPPGARAQDPARRDPLPPTVRLTSDTQVVTLCPEAEAIANPRVRLKAEGHSPDGNQLRYGWSATGGRIEGEGTDVVWNLSGAQPGIYTVSVTVESLPAGAPDPLCTAFTSTKVVVRNCPPRGPYCPNISIYCPDEVEAGRPVTFTASLSGGPAGITPVYKWTVSAGTITSGQGTPSITVDTSAVAGRPITATVEVEGYNLECRATCQSAVPAAPQPRKADEFGDIARDDEKARLDNFAIELQNDPTARGYIIGYGGRRGRAGAGRVRAERARDYLVRTRGIEATRIRVIDGGFGESATTQLWVVPPGATPPSP